MEPGHSTFGVTRLDDQHVDVFPSSPTGLLGAFTATLQARFFEQTGDPPLPWYWDAAPTPTDDDSGGLPEDEDPRAVKGRRLYIEIGPLDQPLARNVRPALIVTRTAIQYQSLGVGRAAAYNVPNRGQLITCHGETSIAVDCIARESGESGSLADVVAGYFYASGREICEEFGLHAIGDPVIYPPEPYARAAGAVPAWSTKVQVPVTLRYRWLKYSLHPILREFRMRFATDSGVTDLRQVVQRQTP